MSSPTRGSSFFLGKVTALGVLCCFSLFVCLPLLASFFHFSFKNMYIHEHAIYDCLSGLWLGGLLYLSVLLKLVCFICTCISMYMYSRCV